MYGAAYALLECTGTCIPIGSGARKPFAGAQVANRRIQTGNMAETSRRADLNVTGSLMIISNSQLQRVESRQPH